MTIPKLCSQWSEFNSLRPHHGQEVSVTKRYDLNKTRLVQTTIQLLNNRRFPVPIGDAFHLYTMSVRWFAQPLALHPKVACLLFMWQIHQNANILMWLNRVKKTSKLPFLKVLLPKISQSWRKRITFTVGIVLKLLFFNLQLILC